MTERKDWDIDEANNIATPPDGAPENHAPSDVNNIIRELAAKDARWLSDFNTTLTTGGSATALTLTLAATTLTTLEEGDLIGFEIGTTCGDAPTLNVNALGADAILDRFQRGLRAGELRAGERYLAVYDGNSWVLLGLDVGAQRFSVASTRTLTVADANTTIYHDGGTELTMTLPASGVIPIGARIRFFNTNDAGSSQNLNIEDGAGPYSIWSDGTGVAVERVIVGAGGFTELIFTKALEVFARQDGGIARVT